MSSTASSKRSSTTMPKHCRAGAVRVPVDDARRHDHQGERDIPRAHRLTTERPRRPETVRRVADRRRPDLSRDALRPMLRMHSSAREIALELVCADGRRLPVLINSVLERDESDEPVVIRTAIFDASHRRKYEEELLARRTGPKRPSTRRRPGQNPAADADPAARPGHRGLEVGGEYRPAGDGSEVGGDFYDIFQGGRRRLGRGHRRRVRKRRRGRRRHGARALHLASRGGPRIPRRHTRWRS